MILRIAVLAGLFYSFTTTMASPTDQTVLAPSDRLDFVRPEGGLPTLADLLTLETRASIFYSYARETDMSARFDGAGGGGGTTLFVPTNKAVQALSRKPHEDPKSEAVGISDAEHEAISKSNVQRWVGAHIVPSPDVNFTSTTPYATLTPGTTIAFQAITQTRPAGEPHIGTDAANSASAKGAPPNVDTDASHLGGIKGRTAATRQCRSRPDADAAHMAAVKGPAGRVDTDAAHFGSIKGPGAPDRAPQPDADAVQEPVWKRYELNDGVNIIAEKQASNGVLYLIDGTVIV